MKVHSRFICLTVASLFQFGCASSENNADSRVITNNKIEKEPTVIFLHKLANVVDLTTARINRLALNHLGVDLSDVDVQANHFTKTSSSQHHRTGIISISYRRDAASSEMRLGTREMIGIGLDPNIVCVNAEAIYREWKSLITSKQFDTLRFGAGTLGAADGLHRDFAEQKRRGNGPIEIQVQVLEPRNHIHQTMFTFDHQYYSCARSVTLTTWYTP